MRILVSILGAATLVILFFMFFSQIIPSTKTSPPKTSPVNIDIEQANAECDMAYTSSEIDDCLENVIYKEKVEFDKLSNANAEKTLPNSHPKYIAFYSLRLWNEGRKDEAHFWYYAALLRFNFYLYVNPHLENSGEHELRDSIRKGMMNDIDYYEMNNPGALATAIDRAIEWDENNANSFVSKKDNNDKLMQVRKSLINKKNMASAWDSPNK
ncbi:MAG: hypothetical protein OCD00_19095 [Colwellia sp.]